MMPFLLSTLGVLVSIGFIGTGAVMNWRYGLGLGRSEADQYLMAGVHLLIDLYKVMMPFFGWWAWNRRRCIVAGGAFSITIAAVSYSAVGIVGFVDMQASFITGGLSAQRDTAHGLRNELSRKERQVNGLGQFEPATVVEQRLARLRQDVRWLQSNQCRDATGRASREYCVEFRGLETELAKANEAAILEVQIKELRLQINALSGLAALEGSDRRVDVVVRVTGWELLRVRTWLSLLFVGIVKFMATFGMFLSLNHGALTRVVSRRHTQPDTADRDVRHEPDMAGRSTAVPGVSGFGLAEPVVAGDIRPMITHQDAGEIVRYIADETEPAKGGIEIADLHDDYVRWCGVNGLHPKQLSAFEVEFDRLRQIPEVAERVSKFGSRYFGVGLTKRAPSRKRPIQ